MLPTSPIKATPVVLLLAFASVFSSTGVAADPLPNFGLAPRQTPTPLQFEGGSSQGCYSSPGGGMQPAGASTSYQSSAVCGQVCRAAGKPVLALHESECLCGDLLPSPSMASDTLCSSTCDGYSSEPCGGPSGYTVWLTGLSSDVGTVGSSSGHGDGIPSSSVQSSSNVPTSSTPVPSSAQHTQTSQVHQHHHKVGSKASVSTQTQAPQVITKTVGSGSSETSKPEDSAPTATASSGSSNVTTIAIAVGVVVGVLVFAGIIAILLFYLRRRRRMKNAENGHRRADSLNAFVAAGGHTPGTIAGRMPVVTLNDNRLDPRIMQETRRESVGSFLADNQDYSRRILKVTNPDGT